MSHLSLIIKQLVIFFSGLLLVFSLSSYAKEDSNQNLKFIWTIQIKGSDKMSQGVFVGKNHFITNSKFLNKPLEDIDVSQIILTKDDQEGVMHIKSIIDVSDEHDIIILETIQNVSHYIQITGDHLSKNLMLSKVPRKKIPAMHEIQDMLSKIFRNTQSSLESFYPEILDENLDIAFNDVQDQTIFKATSDSNKKLKCISAHEMHACLKPKFISYSKSNMNSLNNKDDVNLVNNDFNLHNQTRQKRANIKYIKDTGNGFSGIQFKLIL